MDLPSFFMIRILSWTDDVRFACLIDNVSSMCEYGMSYTGIEINKSEKDVWIVFPYEEWWNDKTI